MLHQYVAAALAAKVDGCGALRRTLIKIRSSSRTSTSSMLSKILRQKYRRQGSILQISGAGNVEK